MKPLLSFFRLRELFIILFLFFFNLCHVNSAYGIFPDKDSFLSKLKEEPPSWMTEQIKKDLIEFEKGIPRNVVDEIYHSINPSEMSLVHFQIIDNQLHSDRTYDASNRSETVLQALAYLIETVGLPNVDFFVSMQDGLNLPNYHWPILAFAKTKNSNSIVLIPDFEALSGYDANQSLTKNALRKIPWKDKEKKAFWRGSTTGIFYTKDNWFLAPRSMLTLLSLERPELVDAKFTSIVQCGDNEVKDILISKSLVTDYTPVKDHLKYRYLIDVDGNSCTYSRCYWILLSNSTLFKPESENIQWYYGGLVPDGNYVPLKWDMSDVFEKVEWAINHDKKARKIAREGTKFASESLSLENIYVYFYKVLLEYAKLQNQ